MHHLLTQLKFCIMELTIYYLLSQLYLSRQLEDKSLIRHVRIKQDEITKLRLLHKKTLYEKAYDDSKLIVEHRGAVQNFAILSGESEGEIADKEGRNERMMLRSTPSRKRKKPESLLHKLLKRKKNLFPKPRSSASDDSLA